MSDSLADQIATTALYGGNADFVEDLYEQFLKDPAAVTPGWARYFAGLATGAAGASAGSEASHRQIRERLAAQIRRPASSAAPSAAAGADPAGAASAKQAAVSRLIQVYANRGHLIANLDPWACRLGPCPTFSIPSTSACRTPTWKPSSSRAAEPRRFRSAASSRISSPPSSSSTATPSERSSRMSRTARSGCGCRIIFSRSGYSIGSARRRRRTFSGSSRRPRAWSATCTPSTSARSASRSRAATASFRCSTSSCSRKAAPASKRP